MSEAAVTVPGSAPEAEPAEVEAKDAVEAELPGDMEESGEAADDSETGIAVGETEETEIEAIPADGAVDDESREDAGALNLPGEANGVEADADETGSGDAPPTDKAGADAAKAQIPGTEEEAKETEASGAEEEKEAGNIAEAENTEETEETEETKETGETEETEGIEETEEAEESEETGEAEETAGASDADGLTWQGDGYAVAARFAEGVESPEGATLEVREIGADAALIQACGRLIETDVHEAETEADDEGETDGEVQAECDPVIEDVHCFTVAVVVDGEAMLPEGGITVSVTRPGKGVVFFRDAGGPALLASEGDTATIGNYAGELLGFGTVARSDLPEAAGAPEAEPVVLSFEGEGYTLEVTCPPEAQVPADAELRVTEPDAGACAEYVEHAEAAIRESGDGDEAIDGARFMTIELFSGDEPIVPAAALEAAIHFEEPFEAEALVLVRAGETVETGICDDTSCGTFEMDGATTVGFGGLVRLPAFEAGSLACAAGNLELTLEYTAETGIPEGAVLTAEVLDTESETFIACAQAADACLAAPNEAAEASEVETGDAPEADAIPAEVQNSDAPGVDDIPAEAETADAPEAASPEYTYTFLAVGVELDGEPVEWSEGAALSMRGDPEALGEGTVFVKITEDGARVLPAEALSATCDDYLPGAIVGYGVPVAVKAPEAVEPVVLTYEGADFTVTVSCPPESGIDAETELRVRELDPESEEYAQCNAQADAALSEDWNAVGDFARYFDIEFVRDGAAIEPAAAVDVRICFAEAIPVDGDGAVQAVHFADAGVQMIDSESGALESAVSAETVDGAADPVPAINTDAPAVDTVAFSADSFSVYGVVQTGKLATKVITAEGETFVITVTYGPDAEIPDGATLNATEITEGDAAYQGYMDAAAEAIGTDDATGIAFARFFDIEIHDAGQAKIEPAAPVQVKIAYDEAVDMDESDKLSIVHFGDAATEVIGDVALSDDGREITYQQESFSTIGTLKLWRSDLANGKRFGLVVEDPDDPTIYYTILEDGTLERANVQSNGTQIRMNYPMEWTYRSNNGYDVFYHEYDAQGYNGAHLATSYYYRYIDPDSPTGLTTDQNNPWDKLGQVKVHYDLVAYSASNVRNPNRFHIYTDNGNYLTIVKDENGVHLASTRDSQKAVIVKMNEIETNVVPELDADNNTVNHIDISVRGKASLQVPLAYGEYPLGILNNDGSVTKVNQTYTVPYGEPESLNLTEEIPIDVPDLKRSKITAMVYPWKNENDHSQGRDTTKSKVIADDMFYITGYSQNDKTGETDDTAQVRVEGMFKVSTVEKYSDYHPWDPKPGDSNADYGYCQYRMDPANRVYYNVTTTKRVTFTYTKTINGVEYVILNEDGTPMTKTLDVSVSSSFDFWDSDNECPGIIDPNIGQYNNWKQGQIPENRDWFGSQTLAYSGMDFRLGGDEEGDRDVVALQIIKHVRTMDGKELVVTQAPDYGVQVFAKSGTDSTTWKDSGMGNEPDKMTDLSGFSYQHDKTLAIKNSDTAMVYDYDVVPGMYYIHEDPAMRDEDVVDSQGRVWEYVNTRIDTEYVWRNNEYTGKVHKAGMYSDADESYNSVPEMLGEYSYNNLKVNVNGQWLNPYNTFLEFNIYNYYQPKTYPVALLKEDAVNSQKLLKYAEFALYGPYATRQDADTEQSRKETLSKQDIKSGEDGIAFIGDLESGYWYLYETKAPAGYLLPNKPVEIVVDSRRESDNPSDNSPVTYTQTGNSAGSSAQVTTRKITVDDQQVDAYTITITNNPGAALPNTGGAGRTAYTCGGLAIMLAAIVALGVESRRRRAH